MSWTYLGDPSASSRDAVRFLVGQTSTSDDVLLTDEEIAYAIAQTNSNYTAAAMCAEAMAARYRTAAMESETIGDTSVTWGNRAGQLDGLAATLRRQGALRSVTPFLGGQSIGDRDDRRADSDLRQPAFTVDQFDYTAASTGNVST